MLRILPDIQVAHDIGNYIRRAREEHRLAAQADSFEGMNAHRRLAHHYEALIRKAGPPPSGTNDEETDLLPFSFEGRTNGFLPTNMHVRSFGMPRLHR